MVLVGAIASAGMLVFVEIATVGMVVVGVAATAMAGMLVVGVVATVVVAAADVGEVEMQEEAKGTVTTATIQEVNKLAADVEAETMRAHCLITGISRIPRTDRLLLRRSKRNKLS